LTTAPDRGLKIDRFDPVLPLFDHCLTTAPDCGLKIDRFDRGNRPLLTTI
jgi:hypothetical protein